MNYASQPQDPENQKNENKWVTYYDSPDAAKANYLDAEAFADGSVDDYNKLKKINIWLYNSEDDTVFLADSGNPGHNRQRIPLRYVYDALKTSDVYQYMLVESVDPDGNTWGHNGIDWDWNPPW